MINCAWDAGVRYLDTAPIYGHGLSELRCGPSLRLKNHVDFVLSSKVGRILRPRRRSDIDFTPWVDAAPNEMVFDYSFDGTMRAFEDSLQRLTLERMDICFIHDIDVFIRGDEQPEVFWQAMDGAWKALAQLRNEGLVKAIGVGVNEWEVCEEALRQRDFDCFLLAGRYTLLEQESLNTFLPLCEERNAAFVVGGGFTPAFSRPGQSRERNTTMPLLRQTSCNVLPASKRSVPNSVYRCRQLPSSSSSPIPPFRPSPPATGPWNNSTGTCVVYPAHSL